MPRLTDDLMNRILVWIRSGAFPHVAAEAEGVPAEVFEQWLALGTRTRPRPVPRYRRFARKVFQAAAVGRLRVEIRLREKDPKTWLTCGPGRERQDYSGWSSAIKPLPRRDKGEVNLFTEPGVAAVLAALLAALAPFPEARQAAAEVLEKSSAPARESRKG